MRCFTIAVLLATLIIAVTIESGAAIQKRCLLPVESGPCLGGIRSWAWDSRQRECVPFVYGGCEGNDNRFDSKSSCEYNCGFRFQ
ncbi:Kunitz-CH [Fasciola hepatica]|uniref:Kunitz-CH n=1 Tax=Fasciola hepatica TaxID=6192 RepID=A0A2H1CUM9_FASHE|nr:Kunitz-CH [Fasciola hepatica]